MEIAVYNVTVMNILSWYNKEETRKKLNNLPLKLQWTIRKNMRAIEGAAKAFGEFREDLMRKRDEEWFTEGNGKCEKTMLTDADGNEREGFKILDEYQDALKAYEDDINHQLSEIALEKNTFEVIPLNFDELVEIADECGADLNMDDIDVLSPFEDKNEDKA